MIPERTFEVITAGFGHVGSASNDKIPTHTDSLGASMKPDKDEVTFFVRESLSQQVLANLEENGRATVFTGVASHEAYQFKGHFLEARELTEDELQASSKNRTYFIEVMSEMGLPRPAVERLFGVAPDIGITIKIEEIFVQTPGPDAGSKLPF